MRIKSVLSRRLIVNQIFLVFLFSVIIFLTGCGLRRYHVFSTGEAGPRETSTLLRGGFGQNFLWPLPGEVVVKFGAEQDLVPSKGVVIESKTSDRVLSAREGTVVLVDQGLKGYGKTIIVGHPDGFSTVYAKNAEILVSPGQRVRQGDWIARAGKGSGGALSRLYFELRKNLKAEDPLKFLRS